MKFYIYKDVVKRNLDELIEFIAETEIYFGEEALMNIIENEIIELDSDDPFDRLLLETIAALDEDEIDESEDILDKYQRSMSRILDSGERAKRSLNEPFIVFFTGKARSGKDTLANIMKKQVEGGSVAFKEVAILAFADWLKDVAKRNHGYENKKTDRDILISTGDRMREVDPDVFAKPVAQMINVYAELGYKLILITDLRFKNEFDYVQKNTKGRHIVLNISSPNQSIGVSEFAKKHPTENLQIEYDMSVTLPFINEANMKKLEIISKEILNILHSDY